MSGSGGMLLQSVVDDFIYTLDFLWFSMGIVWPARLDHRYRKILDSTSHLEARNRIVPKKLGLMGQNSVDTGLHLID